MTTEPAAGQTRARAEPDQVGALIASMTLEGKLAQPLAYEYAELFRGLDDSELDALADSFGFGQCSVRAPLRARLQAG